MLRDYVPPTGQQIRQVKFAEQPSEEEIQEIPSDVTEDAEDPEISDTLLLDMIRGESSAADLCSVLSSSQSKRPTS